MIDSSARIEAGAKIGNDVAIGPFCTIGPHVTIGDGCRLLGHVNVTGHTTIGARTVIYPFASLGSPPQSFSYKGGPTTLVVGADCDIRENVTMNTGTEEGGGFTVGISVFGHRTSATIATSAQYCSANKFHARGPLQSTTMSCLRRRRGRQFTRIGEVSACRPEACAPTSFRAAWRRGRSPIWSA